MRSGPSLAPPSCPSKPESHQSTSLGQSGTWNDSQFVKPALMMNKSGNGSFSLDFCQERDIGNGIGANDHYAKAHSRN